MKETVESFMKNCPEVSDGQLEQMHKKYFTDYIFYKKDKSKIKGYCTHCKSSFEVSRYEEYPFMNEDFLTECNHNSYVTCPHCGKQLLAKSKGVGKQSLYQEKYLAVVYRKGKNKVFIRIGRAYLNFENIQDDHFHGVQFRTHYIYYLSPEQVKCATNYIYYGWMLCSSNKPMEPYSGENINYDFINPQELSKSFLRYGLPYCCGGDMITSYRGYKPIKYLQYLALYPSIEMICKLGLSAIVNDIVDYNNQCKRVVDLTGKSPTEVFKCTKQEFNQIREYAIKKHRISPEYLKCYKALKDIRPNIKVEEAFDFYESNMEWQKKVKLMKLTNLSWLQISNYLKKQLEMNDDETNYNTLRIIKIDYTDYIEECKKLELDLNDTEVSKPKDLYAAHEKTSKLLSALKAEIEEKNMSKLTEKLVKKYSFKNEKYMIRVPATMQEIIYEGKVQHHCVGDYAEDHAKGKTIILFVRQISNPDKPFYTMEINPRTDKIVQCRGFVNNSKSRGGKPKTKDIMDFEKEFERFIAENRLKKTKKKPQKGAA